MCSGPGENVGGLNMIHETLMNQAKVICPDLRWSVNFYTAVHNTGTVYEEGGGNPDTFDFKWRYPDYMIYIRAKDWDEGFSYAQKIFNAFHGKTNFKVIEEDRTFYVQSLFALSEILRVGVDENDNMEYSINFRATLREEK